MLHKKIFISLSLIVTQLFYFNFLHPNLHGSSKTVSRETINNKQVYVLQYKYIKNPKIEDDFIKNKTLKERYINEKFILQNFKHENIVSIAFDDNKSFNDENLTIIEEAGEMNLRNFINKLNQFNDLDPIVFLRLKLKILIDIISGIKHIHKNEYVHRDIKPENAVLFRLLEFVAELINSNFTLKNPEDFIIAKLIDFEFTSQRDTEIKFNGTPTYLSYRLLTNQNGTYYTDDIYAFSLLGFELINGINAYKYLEEKVDLKEKVLSQIKNLIEYNEWPQLLESKIQCDYDVDSPKWEYTYKLNNLFKKCWNKDYTQVPTAKYILNKLNKYLEKLKNIN